LNRFDNAHNTINAINGTQRTMKKLWLALTFFLGGFAHELRNPVSCQCINSRAAVVWRLDGRKDAA
jgi:hypothetical protein